MRIHDRSTPHKIHYNHLNSYVDWLFTANVPWSKQHWWQSRHHGGFLEIPYVEYLPIHIYIHIYIYAIIRIYELDSL